jgi:hypothetical protein
MKILPIFIAVLIVSATLFTSPSEALAQYYTTTQPEYYTTTQPQFATYGSYPYGTSYTSSYTTPTYTTPTYVSSPTTYSTYQNYGTYYPYGSYSNYGNYYGYNSCTTLTYNLYIGLNDATTAGQVSKLQSFLIANNYLTSPVTGYYGSATSRAVTLFQRDRGLPTDGTVGVLTRSAIQQVSCGGNYGYNYGYNYPYNYDGYRDYRYNDSRDDRPQLDSLSPTSGRVGRDITLKGDNFTSRNNTVHFGNGGEMKLTSKNSGTRITFEIPSHVSPCDVNTATYCAMYMQEITPGVYPIYVTNSNGQSNVLYFRVID